MDTTTRDTSRQAATSRDNDYTLSLDEVSERYAKAGHPRTIRTLQRYCASGHLDAQKMATTTGDKYLVTPLSVGRHIAQIDELSSIDLVAPGRVAPRRTATLETQINEPSDDPEPSRHTATGERYLALLERDNDFLRDQIKNKDEQISDLSKRFGETQALLGATQRMLAPLLGQADPYNATEKREVTDPQNP